MSLINPPYFLKLWDPHLKLWDPHRSGMSLKPCMQLLCHCKEGFRFISVASGTAITLCFVRKGDAWKHISKSLGKQAIIGQLRRILQAHIRSFQLHIGTVICKPIPYTDTHSCCTQLRCTPFQVFVSNSSAPPYRFCTWFLTHCLTHLPQVFASLRSAYNMDTNTSSTVDVLLTHMIRFSVWTAIVNRFECTAMR
jgi:hypothetical protein